MLEGILGRILLIVGIRAANLPTGLEKNILIEFVRKWYPGLTVAELLLAFEKAVAGELEEDANCFENFSCQYVGKIMVAFKKWASQKFNENQMYIVPKKETENKKSDWKGLCESCYQEFLQGKLNFDLLPWPLYDEFSRAEMMSADAYGDYLEDAEKHLLTKFINYRELSESENERFEWQQKIESLKNEEERIIEVAKKMSVMLLYRTAKKKGIKNLFV